MKIVEDLHIHSKFSKDSKEEPEKYLPVAIERGIEYLGFSEHIDLDPVDKDFGYYKYDEARECYLELNEKYGDRLNFLFATELTYQSTLEESVRAALRDKPYDYVIGSVHRLEGFTISGPKGTGYFEGKDEKTAYNIYFEELLKMAQMDFFEILGHLDVIKRYGIRFYGPFFAKRYEGIIMEVLRHVVSNGKVIEINSSGFRQGVDEQYPSNDILAMYRNAGGTELAIGSDAHNVKDFGAYLEESVENALSVYDFDVVAFRNKKKIRLCKLSDLF
ncbi:MAG: histidinol-phosphatase HisJ family protein [Caldisericaceae bacterium]